ncbi:hypothetical protein BST63_36365 [Bradyrhizobium canariense]|jgi:hypothetical protein|uniref:Uncharacterized protein n=1 Tax=Bradyrhizobium canariense TaxID=255045 RepID=A0A1X3GPD5_9BRAD|nr:hypothetical protein BST65_20195 [Bradyrhizobium canariense]OSI28898.1 hypothetical protein BST66_27555 [Bradyrhizobium canariense]OSI46574.1 hypothetical protein BSZ20_10325 [Bradyrhizobium canariense]OSI53697.1 hypothetical protein BST67_08385 [Bradyrhizobium canariense]OSI57380.1 hypothetical protein BSZ15_13890 [Bradyrhizobium canariense]
MSETRTIGIRHRADRGYHGRGAVLDRPDLVHRFGKMAICRLVDAASKPKSGLIETECLRQLRHD